MRWKEIHASTLLSDAVSGFFRSSASKTVSESMMSRSSTMSVAARLQAVTADSEQQKRLQIFVPFVSQFDGSNMPTYKVGLF